MQENINRLVQLIDAAEKAPLPKKPKLISEAAKLQAKISNDLVQAFTDLQTRVSNLERAGGE